MYMQAQDMTHQVNWVFVIKPWLVRGRFYFPGENRHSDIAQVVNITFIRDINTTRLNIIHYELKLIVLLQHLFI